MELPQNLKTAIDDAIVSEISPKRLAIHSQNLSHRYRVRDPQETVRFIQSEEDVAAYAIYRMPATFGAIVAAFNQIKPQLPTWHPQSLLDAGAGPGTVMWAANHTWDTLTSVTLLEQDAQMITTGQRLASQATESAIQNAQWIHHDVTKPLAVPAHDLVTSAYVVNELPPAKRALVVNQLWSLTKQVLIIIEPGTPDGFRGIKALRQQLIDQGAHIIAPCPHQDSCPNQWCHFSQRVDRSSRHRQLKKGTLAYEDEKFSFVAASRIPGKDIASRIIRHPQIKKGHMIFELCTPRGIETQTVTRKDRALYRLAKRARWGSVFPPPDF